MTERVDKNWKSKGLGDFSNESIFATLAHYGVKSDEQSFTEQTREDYPLTVASKWQSSWEGMGQFAAFPAAAAEELFRRFQPEKLLPSKVSTALAELMDALDEESADVADRFAAAEALLPRIPRQKDKTLRAFMEEVVFYLGEEAWEDFNGFGQTLASQEKLDFAERFARLEVSLFPEREGMAQAMVRAGKGELKDAVNDLVALVKAKTGDSESQLSALDGLLHLEANAEALPLAMSLFDAAEAAKDFHFGIDLADRLEYLFGDEKLPRPSEELLERIDSLIDEHDEVHDHS